MGPAPRQLPLLLPAADAKGADDFLVTDSNREAVQWLNLWPAWPGQGLVIHGPPASGKSHLLAIWAARSGAERLHGADLTTGQALAAAGPVALDDADACTDEAALFHLLNRVRAGGHAVLLTAGAAPAGWPTALPDLVSRLRALPAVALGPPDDSLLAGLAAKLFADRQITVADGVIAYMLARLERSCAAVAVFVERLDRAALAARRPVTVALAREVFESSNNT